MEQKDSKQIELVDKTKTLSNLGIGLAHWTVTILLIGLVYHLVYYWYFSLPVKYFLNISEVALLASNELLVVGGSIILIVLNIAESHHDNSDNANLSDKQRKIRNLVFIVIYFGLALFTYTIDDKKNQVGLSGFLAMLSSVALGFVYPKLFKRLTEIQIYLISLVSMLLGYVLLTASIYIEKTIDGKYNGTFIELKDGTTFISNDSIMYIGKTEKYIFIHHRKDTSNDIIPVEDVKKFRIKMK
jgi:hypothetical protein